MQYRGSSELSTSVRSPRATRDCKAALISVSASCSITGPSLRPVYRREIALVFPALNGYERRHGDEVMQ